MELVTDPALPLYIVGSANRSKYSSATPDESSSYIGITLSI